MKKPLKILGLALLTVLMGVVAILFYRFGFDQMSDVRQLDRLPMTPISALSQGVYSINGTIQDSTPSITAPYSQESVVYYSYRLEEEYTDSDGDRKTRTLDSGQSATPFTVQDTSGAVTVNPGYQISEVEWHAQQTYKRRTGKKIYTETTLRAGDRVELLAWYKPKAEQIELSEMPFELESIVTSETLKKAGGNSLLVASLLISAASACLAVGLALALVVFGVHRYWVFVVVMTLGLIAALWTIGIFHLNKDWQYAAKIYQDRAEGALIGNNIAAQEDLYAMHVLIKRSADQWPDSTLFSIAARKSFRAPAIDDASKTRIEGRLAEVDSSRFQHQTLALIIAAAGLVLTIALILFALKAIRFKRLVEFIPTSTTTGLSYGITELFGMIEVDDDHPYLTSQLNDQKCVAYEYDISEKRGSGKNSKWVSIESGESRSDFLLEDNSGRVAINPDGATIRYPERKTYTRDNRRYTESWLPPYRNIYCLGFAGIADEHADRLSIQKSEQFEMLITTQEEEDVVKDKGARGFIFTGLALGFSLMAGTVWLAASGSLTPMDLIKVSLIVPFTLLAMTMALHYNSLVFLKNRVDKTRADIDTLLQRRHDLWPQLLSTVQGFMSHEKKLMQAMGKLRSGQANFSDNPEQAAKQFNYEQKVVKSFVARIEAYPELKSNSLIQTFTQQMKRSEDELALIRQGYNDSVELYNTQIEKLPDVILAKLFGFKAEQLFEKG